MYFQAQRTGRDLRLTLLGEWRALQLRAIGTQLAALQFGNAARLRVDAAAMRCDIAGAWLLNGLFRRARAAGLDAQFEGAAPEGFGLVERTLRREPIPELPPVEQGPDPATYAVERIGRRAVRGYRDLLAGLGFFGRICAACAGALVSPRRLRPTAIVRHVYDAGITAIPIVALIAFLISVIMAYMGAAQLGKFGANIFVVDLVTIGVLRELGVLLTAIIVAGRSGSAFAAEIGAMRLNQEVDALQAMAVDPIEALVLPRMLGMLVALPLLTIIADGIGLVGGGLLCHALLDMPLAQYVNRVQGAIAPTTFWVGLVKAPVFALLIGFAGCYCGLRVRGSSRELGRMTTLAVVQSIFFVILADALFAVLFMRLDI